MQFLKKDSTTSEGHILVDLMTKAYDEEPDRHNVITVDQVRTVYWGGKLDQTQIDYFQVEWLDEQTVDIAGHVINPFKEKIDHYRE